MRIRRGFSPSFILLIVLFLAAFLAGTAVAGKVEAVRAGNDAARREVMQRMGQYGGAAILGAPVAKNGGVGQLVYSFTGHAQNICSVAYSPDGTQVLTGSWDGTARLWDVATGALTRTFQGENGSSLWGVAFSPDGQEILGGCFNIVYLWDVATGETLRTFAGEFNSPPSVAFSPDGTRVLTASSALLPMLWDAATGTAIRTFTGHTDWVYSVAFSPDGTQVLTGSWDGTARLWNAETGDVIRTFTQDVPAGKTSSSMWRAVFAPNGLMIATIDTDTNLWDPGTGALLMTAPIGGIGLAFSPDSARVFSGSWSATPALWDVSTGNTVCTFSESGNTVYSAAFSPDGARVATGGVDAIGRLWNIVEGSGEGEGEVVVSGSVSDARNDVPLSDASVTLFNFATGALLDTAETDVEGWFSLTVPNMTAFLSLHVEKTGYDSFDLSYFRAPASVSVRLTPLAPPAPSVLTAIPGVAEILLRWNASSSAEVAGYRVYRGEAPEGSFTLLTPVLVSGTRFTDTTPVANQDYWYRVTAVGTNGDESAPTAPVEAHAGQAVVWMPDIHGAAGERIRIPINVTNTAGINPAHMRIVLAYSGAPIDAGSLEIQETAITAGVPFTTDTGTAGQIVIETSGGAVLAGEGRIFDVYATIPGDAQEAVCGTLSFGEVVFQDALTNAISVDYTDTAQVCVSGDCKLGDLDSDTFVQMADASVALQIAVKKITAQGCQPVAGDMNGDGLIDSADAVMIMRVAEDRPLNPEADETPVRGRNVRVYIPEGLSAAPGGTVDVPVLIDDATGLSACELFVAFPPQTALLVLDSVEPGAATQDFTIEYETGNGFVRIAMSQALALAGGKADSTLAILHFSVPSSATGNASLPVGLNEVKLAGQYGDDFAWQNAIEKSSSTIAVNSLVCGAVVVSVVDDATSLPVTSASVLLSPGPPFPLTQNTEGLYTFACINPGSCHVSAGAAHYDTGEGTVFVQGGEVSTVTIRLRAGNNTGGCCGATVQRASPPGWAPFLLLTATLAWIGRRKTFRAVDRPA